MARLSLNHRVQWLPIVVTVVCAATLALLLFTGVRLAARLQSASAALQLASSLTAQPQLLRAELTLIQRGLETQTYVGDSLRALRTNRAASNQSYAQLAAAMQRARLDQRQDTAAVLAQARGHWQPLDAALAQLETIKAADLYADNAGGSTLTATGSMLKRAVDELLATQAKNTTALGDELSALAALLREAVGRGGGSLRTLLLAGAALASLVLAIMLYFSWRAGQAATVARETQRQIGNILGTVREGLFLIAKDGRVGGAHSDSLTALLRTATPAGQTFEELLRPLVAEKTLAGATKYLGLLWRDRVNEELIESVNPLNQIEVQFQKPQGATETRFLSFSFRRARGTGLDTDFVLGSVADVTDRVLLQQELEQLRSNSDANSTLLSQLLQADPLQLQSFLTNVDAAVHNSNALLRTPGANTAELHQKIHGVFRQLHTIKGEAAALAMDTFVQRTHTIEGLLAGLRERADITGDNFVPVVVKLDELLSHTQTVAAMQERVGHARAPTPPTDLRPEQAGDSAGLEAARAAAAPHAKLEQVLRRLAEEVSTPGVREVRLATEGLDKIPAEYYLPVRNICIQMVRNAIVHGIEPLEVRAAAGKPPQGTIRLHFEVDNPREYSLLIEDDGQGLSPTKIRDRALDRGMVDAEQAASLDRSGAFRLIFQPGFSTAEEVTEHAGRGVGLDVVNTTVQECGGRIGIATAAGKYTRFKLILPRRPPSSTSQSSAA